MDSSTSHFWWLVVIIDVPWVVLTKNRPKNRRNKTYKNLNWLDPDLWGGREKNMVTLFIPFFLLKWILARPIDEPEWFLTKNRPKNRRENRGNMGQKVKIQAFFSFFPGVEEEHRAIFGTDQISGVQWALVHLLQSIFSWYRHYWCTLSGSDQKSPKK